MELIQLRLQVLRVNWEHPGPVEKWLREQAIGRTLNVCCGMSKVGETRVDILPYPKSNATETGNVLAGLKYGPGSFDTVICDPPFKYYNRFKWIQALSLLARKRFLVSSPPISLSGLLPRFKPTLYAFPGNGTGSLFLRLYWCFDRIDGIVT